MDLGLTQKFGGVDNIPQHPILYFKETDSQAHMFTKRSFFYYLAYIQYCYDEAQEEIKKVMPKTAIISIHYRTICCPKFLRVAAINLPHHT